MINRKKPLPSEKWIWRRGVNGLNKVLLKIKRKGQDHVGDICFKFILLVSVFLTIAFERVSHN